MKINRQIISDSLDALEYQWDMYLKLCKREGYDVVLRPRNILFNVGDLVYINYQVGYPHEMAMGHWSYVLKDVGSKLLVIPAAHNNGKREDIDIPIATRYGDEVWDMALKTFDLRFVDVQRIYAKKGVMKCITDHSIIVKKVKEIVKLC